MTISAVTSATATQADTTAAKVQLDRDEKKLVADMTAKAGAAQLAADNAAIASDEMALGQTAGTSSLDTYL